MRPGPDLEPFDAVEAQMLSMLPDDVKTLVEWAMDQTETVIHEYLDEVVADEYAIEKDDVKAVVAIMEGALFSLAFKMLFDRSIPEEDQP